MRSYIHWSFPFVPTALTRGERLTKLFSTLSPSPYLHTNTHTCEQSCNNGIRWEFRSSGI